jgi:solute carrier family 25 phosphate transporter 23/24/25/41
VGSRFDAASSKETGRQPNQPNRFLQRSPPARRPQSAAANLLVGATSGTLAATACYPLDTIRRRMQMRGHAYAGQLDAFRTIWRVEGARGFYRGWAANTIKVVPQNAIRLVTYETLKGAFGVQRAKTDT